MYINKTVYIIIKYKSTEITNNQDQKNGRINGNLRSTYACILRLLSRISNNGWKVICENVQGHRTYR